MPGNKPMLNEVHFGSRARRLALDENPSETIEEALSARETKLGHLLSEAEKRQFYHGWRLGLYHFACDEIKTVARYLNADQLDAYGNLLYGLARQLGMARTKSEDEVQELTEESE